MSCLLEQVSIFFVFVFWLLLVRVCLVWCFTNMHFHILCEKPFVSYYSNHGLAVVETTNKLYQNMVFYFLSFAICLFVVELVLNIIPIYHREISLYTPCPWQVILVIVVDFVDHLHIGSCVKLTYLLPSLPLAHILFFQLVVFSVGNKIWRVMIPCVCILYSNANIKDNAWILGEHSFLFRTLTYLSSFDPFNWHLVLYLQLVLIVTLSPP